MTTGSRTTARLVIIGNEILGGKVVDSNGPFLLRRLRQLGVQCTGIAVVPDEIPTIAQAVRAASEGADLVFTSGGVGPTHDDCTMAGIAAAFGVGLVDHPELVRLLQEHWTGPKAAARMRMARVPAGAKLVPGRRFPQVVVRNVYVLPGVPELLRAKFEAMAERFATAPIASAALRTQQGESELAPHLEAVDAAYQGVELGSYPQWGSTTHRVLVTLEGDDRAQVEAALDDLAGRLDPAALVDVDRDHHPEAGGDDAAT